MENKLLKVGFTLLLIGSLSAITLCIIALLSPLFFPAVWLFLSFIIILSGFIIVFIDCENDLRRQQKIYEDVERLISIYYEKEKRDLLDRILISRLFSQLENLDE
jgi:uncharacterized membrane protein